MTDDLSSIGLDEDQRELASLVREFAEQVVAPQAYEAYRSHTLNLDVVRQMGELGLFGLPFPEEYGGQGVTTSPWASRSRPSHGSISPLRSPWRQE
ncbi:hypothetical protein GCM10025863_09680 [Microbacterium suwonense]|uniref:Acyl-CoA dehydrogenase/oxidase N-terminal domain-containing protein n=1 Tax=Microbacterium suwonense TaxID=683047 RepID=A0ABM8FSF3_9MICO|nr:hypothetical protein GCM10025863_09680 [Microbacterium suwonense]